MGMTLSLALASALDDGLALTPPRGWRSWNSMLLNVSQGKVLAQAAALAREYPDLGPSLLALNYSEVGIDDGWQKCHAGVNGTFHDANGFAIWDVVKFPDAKAMVREAKTRYGVGIGWYGNNCACAERQGHAWPWYGGGHPRQDAQMAFDLGFSGIKIDGCGPALNISLWTDEVRSCSTNANPNVGPSMAVLGCDCSQLCCCSGPVLAAAPSGQHGNDH